MRSDALTENKWGDSYCVGVINPSADALVRWLKSFLGQITRHAFSMLSAISSTDKLIHQFPRNSGLVSKNKIFIQLLFSKDKKVH